MELKLFPSIFYKLAYYNKIKPKSLFYLLPKYYHKSIHKNPLWIFKKILKIEKSFGVNSTWFFISSKKDRFTLGSPLGNTNYRIYDDIVRNIMINLKENGHEIGLHTGYCSFNDYKLMKKEKLALEKTINSKVIGVRNHCLMFDFAKTWKIQNELGFKYDATYGYNDFFGPRNGILYPFHGYDFTTNNWLSILELPMSVMDGTFMLSSDYSFETILKKCLETINSYSQNYGVMVLNFHPRFFDNIRYKNNDKLYKKVLQYCIEKKAWITNCRDFFHWNQLFNVF